MTDIKKLIGETTEYDKKQQLEAKKPKSWLKSVSAFANGNGGTLVFGITDDDEIVGVENAESDAEIISEQIKAKMDPVPDVDLRIEMVDGKKLVILKVRRGDETPYFYYADGNRTAFVRIGNESVVADSMMLKRLVLKGYKRSYDSLPSEYDFDKMAFTKLKSICFQRTHTAFLDTDYESWGLTDADGRLTNAGALLADESPIRHSRVFCTRWNGKGKAGGLIDALDDAEYSGSLLILLQEMMGFINRNNHKMWKKLPTHRLEMPDYPERAITEACVNALIHRDYLEMGSEVHVDIYDDRLEIYSPGGMYDGSMVQDLNLANVVSKRRNPVLADVFSRLKLMERRGSGFKKIMEDYAVFANADQRLQPQFRSDPYNFFVVLPNINYDESALQSSIDAIAGISERQQSIVDLIRSDEKITLNEIAAAMKIGRRTVVREINELRELGIIRREGSDFNGCWIVCGTEVGTEVDTELGTDFGTNDGTNIGTEVGTEVGTDNKK